MKKIAVVLAASIALVGLVPMAAQAKRTIAPSCTVTSEQLPNSMSRTVEATYVDVPKGGSTTFTVDGQPATNPTTVTTEGYHTGVCQILDRKGNVLASNSQTVYVAPNWQATLTAVDNGDGTVTLHYTTTTNTTLTYDIVITDDNAESNVVYEAHNLTGDQSGDVTLENVQPGTYTYELRIMPGPRTRADVTVEVA
jgi:hypothetical protein